MNVVFKARDLRKLASSITGNPETSESLRSILATPSRQGSSAVRIIEVGPRDGLQNISVAVPKTTKVELINRLMGTGILNIEATSFVSPKWIPQLADGKEVLESALGLGTQKSVRFSVLAPNLKGYENAVAAGAKEVVVFASATESFSQKIKTAQSSRR